MSVEKEHVGVKIEALSDRTIVRAGGWNMTVWPEAGDEPRIRDIDAGARLGFERPRDIRKIIARIWPQSAGLHCRATVARQSTGNGGVREYTVDEVWLTEAQLLKVIARSETPIAEAILDEMIEVYVAVRRGFAHRLMSELVRREIERLREQLEARAAEPPPFGSQQRVRTLRQMSATLASLWTRLDPQSTQRAEGSRVQSKMRAAIGFAPQRGHSLNVLTTDQFERAVQWLHAEIADAERRIPRVVPTQLSLVKRAS
jgi:hypothetical protein